MHDCFWKDVITESQSSTDVRLVNTYTVRIPAEEAGDNFAVCLEDIVVRGECPDVISKGELSSAELLRKYKPKAFKVTAFSDNTSHLMDKHYRLGG
ncbi:MAG TPA: hypothetical protein DHV42_02390 [Lachnospiraceae bacterium]|nr:hypothetical protein [Lachnospiraceae bacterium]